MNSEFNTQMAIERLIGVSPVLKKSYQALMSEWQPQSPPITLVFAALGRCVSVEQDQLSHEVAKSIWSTVEDLLVSGSEVVKDAVATGFTEAVLSEVSSGRLSSSRFVPYIGSTTRMYCQEWDKFSGCSTEGI